MYSGTYLESIVSQKELDDIKARDCFDIESENDLGDGLFEVRLYSKLPLNDFIGD